MGLLMGMDPEGILFWGIAYSDEDELPDDIDDKADEYETAKQKAEVPEPEGDDYESDEWSVWRGAIAAWEAGQCGMSTRGSRDYCAGDKYVFPNASRKKAEWSETVEVTSLEVPADWRPKLEAYCRDLGLPWREPKWWLTSFYG